jgi:Outer membrane efflux protein
LLSPENREIIIARRSIRLASNMNMSKFRIWFSMSVACASTLGCKLHYNASQSTFGTPEPAFAHTQIQPSDPTCITKNTSFFEESSLTRIDPSSMTGDQFQPIDLHECIHLALSSSQVMRDLGLTIIRNPQSSATNLDPALTFADPRTGEEAALSAFDANFFASSFYEKNDRGINNSFFGINGNFQQDLSTSQIGINKRSATGGLFSFRQVSIYDRNNQLSNRFIPYSWETYSEAQIRQPLLQGAGTEFNRIAGPGSAAGQYNGVLIARVRTDISLIDFERSVRDFVAEVENAYWDLHYAYRDLEAKVQVRKIASETLELYKERKDSGKAKIAQAAEQVHRFQSEVVDSLNGRLIDGTRTNNGSTGGTFRGTGGIRTCERRLRFIIGMPINDGKLLQPTEKPQLGAVVYDWHQSIADAIDSREELRRQRWVVKQRELELIASRNFLKPNLDAVSIVRMRGFGDDLSGPNSATSSLFNGDYAEWQLGLEYQTPVGFRRGHAGQREMERAIQVSLSNAIDESSRAFENLVLQEKRLDDIVLQLNAMSSAMDNAEKAELDVRLETHRRLLDARLKYAQAEVEYMLALRNVNLERGRLLDYHNIGLSEACSCGFTKQEFKRRIHDSVVASPPRFRDAVIGHAK